MEQAVVERQRVGEHHVQVFGHRLGRRHPGEVRELVHQSLERFDLATIVDVHSSTNSRAAGGAVVK